MKLTLKDSAAALTKTDLLVLFAPEGAEVELPAGVKLPAAALGGFQGEAREQRATYLAGGPAKQVLVVGLGAAGKLAELGGEGLRRAAALGIKAAQAAGHARLTLWVAPAIEELLGAAATGTALAEGAVMAAYACTEFKSKPPAPKTVAAILCGGGAAFKRGARMGELRALGNGFARDLQNAPGNRLRPRDMVARARKLAAGNPRIRCQVLDEKAMRALGMGSLLSVSKGSAEPAYLIHLSYKPRSKPRGRVALVGKGLTFDAGGISIKPSAGMEEMKFDMSGGAAVLGVFHALAAGLEVRQEVHGVVPCSENLINGRANKPGDVVTAMDGTTIEVLNTDAEGRLILCDALCYTKKKIKPDTVIDIATLTGAVITALGHELSGIFPSTDGLRDALMAAGDAVGERTWPLPLLDCHREQMKSKLADLRNINVRSMGNGSIAGAAFLAHFVGDLEWCHVDIAGTAWNSVDRDYVGGPNGSGVGVRLLLEYLQNR